MKIALQPVPLAIPRLLSSPFPSGSRRSDAQMRLSHRRIPLQNLSGPTYLLCHHTVTNSLWLQNQSIPLFSTNSTLLWQITRGGGVPAGFKPPASSLQTEPPASRIGQNHARSITQPSHQHHPLSASHRRRTAMPLPRRRPFLRTLPSPRCDRTGR